MLVRRTVLAAVVLAATAAALPLQVKTRGGALWGVQKDGVVSFKGIPFAQPPTGDLRWRAPRAAAPWKGVRDAGQFSASCMQRIVDVLKPWTYEFMTHTSVSEDCLYLNVWSAAASPKERRPVFVYIYGGALTSGSGAVPVYDGAGLARKGLVVVTFNYRVGVFGFLAHPELSAEAGHHASGNYGFMDQVAALQWVHDNIAAFGGDPARVTIAGQSAGATSVHVLTASPLAKGLFHRAIAQSGSSITGLGLMGARPLAQAEEDGARFADSKGAKTLAELRALPTDKLMNGGPRFGAVVDGYFLPESVGALFAAGKQNDVPTLTGTNADDLGVPSDGSLHPDAWRQQAEKRFGAFASRFLEIYPASSDDEVASRRKQSARDQSRVSMYLWALQRARTAKTGAFTYYWNHTLPGPDSARYAAFHTSEVPYALHTLYVSDRPFTEDDRRVEEQMSSYWTNFALHGDPNGKGLAAWPAVAPDKPVTMQVGDQPGPIAITSTPQALEFWKDYFAGTVKR